MKIIFTSNINIEKKIKALQEGITAGVNAVTDFLYEKFQERLKYRFFSLKELKQLDHPYARRHYNKSFFNINLSTLLNDTGIYEVPLGIINKQSGNLLSALKKEIQITSLKGSGRVFINFDQVPYAKYVFYGTKYLIARPIHLAILITYQNFIKQKFYTSFQTAYKMALQK